MVASISSARRSSDSSKLSTGAARDLSTGSPNVPDIECHFLYLLGIHVNACLKPARAGRYPAARARRGPRRSRLAGPEQHPPGGSSLRCARTGPGPTSRPRLRGRPQPGFYRTPNERCFGTLEGERGERARTAGSPARAAWGAPLPRTPRSRPVPPRAGRSARGAGLDEQQVAGGFRRAVEKSEGSLHRSRCRLPKRNASASGSITASHSPTEHAPGGTDHDGRVRFFPSSAVMRPTRTPRTS